MIAAETLVKHTAHLRWVDPDGHEQGERHAAWTAKLATTKAYRRARSMMLSGQAAAYRIEHHEKAYDGGSCTAVNDPFAIPDAA